MKLNTMKDLMSKGGLPKGQAVIWAFAIAVMGFFVLRNFPQFAAFINATSFLLAWVILLMMIHNPTLDKPEDCYEYKIESEVSFIDGDQLGEYLDGQGKDGWSLIAIVNSNEQTYMTYNFVFKRKYYCSDKVTVIKNIHIKKQ